MPTALEALSGAVRRFWGYCGGCFSDLSLQEALVYLRKRVAKDLDWNFSRNVYSLNYVPNFPLLATGNQLYSYRYKRLTEPGGLVPGLSQSPLIKGLSTMRKARSSWLSGFVTGVLGALLCLSISQAATINVPADQPTIQAGIDAAVDGDTALVASGTYVENIDFIGNSVTLLSMCGRQVFFIIAEFQTLYPDVPLDRRNNSKSNP